MAIKETERLKEKVHKHAVISLVFASPRQSDRAIEIPIKIVKRASSFLEWFGLDILKRSLDSLLRACLYHALHVRCFRAQLMACT